MTECDRCGEEITDPMGRRLVPAVDQKDVDPPRMRTVPPEDADEPVLCSLACLNDQENLTSHTDTLGDADE